MSRKGDQEERISKDDKQRRHVTEVATEESIAKEIDFVLCHLRGAERMQVPASSEDEEQRRSQIIGEAAKRMFVAGLLCVKAYQPRQYKALATAALRYVTDGIEKGTATFTVQKPRGPKAFWEWMLGTTVLAAYDDIVGRLENAWKAPSGVAPRPLRLGTPEAGPYGEAQHIGTHRRHQQNAYRARAVREAAQEVFEVTIDDRTARGWVKKEKTPSAVALAIVGHCLERSPRAVKDLLNKARKQLAFARQADLVAAARGLSGTANEPQIQPEAPLPEERES